MEMQIVEGLLPSKVIDVLLSSAPIGAGESERPRFPDVHEQDIVATDRDDGLLRVEFTLDPGFPRKAHVTTVVPRATAILDLAAETLVGIAPPIVYVEVTAL